MPLTSNRTVAPTVYPVTLDEVLAHLRIDASPEENTMLTTLITVASEFIEDYCDRALLTQTWTLKLDAFPCEIRPPRPQLIAVSSIVYVATDGTNTTMSAADYLVDSYGIAGRITPAYGLIWPSTRAQNNAVTVTYTAGYGAAATAVPAAIKQAALIIVADLYESRESMVTGQTVAHLPVLDRLLGPHRSGEYR